MSKRSKKLPKKRQNSDYWIYGHHAVVGALINNNRVKYEVYFTSEAEKKLKGAVKLENIDVTTIKKTRDEIDLLLKGISNHQGICLRVEKIQTPLLSDFVKNLNKEKNKFIIIKEASKKACRYHLMIPCIVIFSINLPNIGRKIQGQFLN